MDFGLNGEYESVPSAFPAPGTMRGRIDPHCRLAAYTCQKCCRNAPARFAAAICLRADSAGLGDERAGQPGEEYVESALEFGGAVVAGQHGGKAAEEGKFADREPVQA